MGYAGKEIGGQHVTIVMLVTTDKYELPLIVADSIAELAREIGRTPTDLYSAMSRARKRGGDD